MRNLLQKLPFPVEFAVVVAGAFGLAIVTSLLVALKLQPGAVETEPELWRAVALQAVTLVVLGLFLKVRGWTAARLGLESHWSDGAWGVALVAAGAIVVYLVLFILLAAAPDLGRTAAKVSSHPAALSPYIVAAIILVSSFTREFFVSGYVITALKEKGLLNAGVNASVAIRLLTHLDQGALEVVLIIPIGLIFATWYARTGKLWPLIVANALINAMNFVPHIKW